MSTQLHKEHLNEIRARLEAATRGPWELYPEYGEHFYAYLGGEYLEAVGTLDFGDGEQADADKALVLSAPQDILWLLQEVYRLCATVAELRPQLATAERQLADLDERCATAEHSTDHDYDEAAVPQ